MNPFYNKISYLIFIMAVLTISACSGGNGISGGEGGGREGKSSTLAQEQKAAKGLNPEGFPIVEENISLEFFTGLAPSNSSNFEETIVWEMYKKKTNMNISFTLVPFDSLNEKRNLMLVGGNYPDAFYSARIPAADLMKYGERGTFIPLNDLIDQYAPNFKALLEQHPDLQKGLTMPDGNIYSFPSFYSPDFLAMLIGTPIWINEDWLAELGLEEPRTINEFYEFLKAVQASNLAGGSAVPFGAVGFNTLKYHLQGAWGLGTRGIGNAYLDIDPATNNLRFYRTTDQYREMLEFIHQLYAENLLDLEIFTIQESNFREKGAEEVYGAVITTNPITAFNLDNYVGLGALEGPYGDRLYSHVKAPLAWIGAFVITDKNPHPEATVRWIDWFFSDEGADFYFRGIEGETFEYKEDGTWDYVKDITDNANGLTVSQARNKYFTWNGGSYPGYVQDHYFMGAESYPNALETGEKAAPYAPEEIWNPFTYTAEENNFMASVAVDIHTYMAEMESKFIAGDTPFSEWDSYIATIERMGFDKYMEIANAAYERYMNN
ncbi:extracellular solute-binding protein [Paenibacillus senegalensis]|uniref:extracellular solute-binding protein n=1 Tax=Paenibacillus senegalensis TaxID=1465766 RepID=UPI00028884F0|nr:extracellular solute-binding protein [Paenibacillus senegalensis]